jgi:tRNA pseudouridine55 synthase
MAHLAGILNIDKPLGITSHDVVGQVRRVAGMRRVGHGGTLDPLASGVLVVALGVATRLLEYVTGQPKSYEAVVRLGQSSTTYDAEGELRPGQSPGELDPDQLEEALARFRGPVEQLPPMYSAVKRGGQPLYKLARQGIDVEREPRRVTIYELELLAWSAPDLHLSVRCSAGTYIRSLAHDLGAALGTGGYLAALRRTAVGSFTIATSIPLDTLSPDSLADQLWPLDSAVAHLPRLDVDKTATEQLRQGQRLPRESSTPGDSLARVYGPEGNFAGIVTASGNEWQPHKIFGQSDGSYGR